VIEAKDSTLPNLKYLSYSTCSILQEENEKIVENILEEFGKSIKLVKTGIEEYHSGNTENTTKCVRVCPKCSGDQGFFVALFKLTGKKIEKKEKPAPVPKKEKKPKGKKPQGKKP